MKTARSAGRTVPAAVEEMGQRHPDAPFLHDATGGEPRLHPFGDVARQMTRYASVLIAHGLSAGDLVVLLAPNGGFLLHTFLGVQRAGGLPVIMYPPGATPSPRVRDHLAALLVRSQAKGLIVARKYLLAGIVPEGSDIPGLRFVLDEDAFTVDADVPLPPVSSDGEGVSHLQFTSGSTQLPRGVLVTHRNVLDNIRSIVVGTGMTLQDRVVSWLPLAHDMGLIGATLTPLLTGCPLYLMLPSQFVVRPGSWLRAISTFRGTVTFSPNFGYQRCVSKVRPAELQDLDLSSLRLAFSGGEPVLRSTVEAFVSRFAPCGLRPHVIAPGYGLAECTLGVSCKPFDQPVRFDDVHYDALTAEGRAVPGGGSGGTVSVCSVGRRLPGTWVLVANERGEPVAERIVGEILVAGSGATGGYYRDPAASDHVFRDGWVHTGDYGYLADGELFIIGRKKDLIIKAGRNYRPEDFERIVAELPGVRAAVSFGLSSDDLGTERIVVLAETAPDGVGARESLITRCHEQIRQQLGVAVDEVVLVPPHFIRRTTNGKVCRAQNRHLYGATGGTR